MERKLLAQRRVELDPVVERVLLTFVTSAVTGGGVSWYKDQQSQQEKITNLTIAVEALRCGIGMQAERLENLEQETKKRFDEQEQETKKRFENLEQETKKRFDEQGKQLEEIRNMLKEKRGRFFR